MSLPFCASENIPRDLPIIEVLPALLDALQSGTNAVLQAPPGAGKTTAVPLALLDQPWVAGRRLIMIEPRRLAARAAATRIASLLGQEVGKISGYRVKLESRVSAATRIEIVTDGVFTRMIQHDPGLENIAAVLFDEFHERRLETDLGLALCLDAQSALRPDLRLLAMSATLDAAPLATLMDDAAILTAQGRSYPIEIRYLPQASAEVTPDSIIRMIDKALEEPGGILVFLPGAAEIRRIERLLRPRLPANIDLLPLYGDLDAKAQMAALAPTAAGRRKLVLATSIAETSLTIDGIRQVVDGGLSRLSRYDPRSGMTRLDTVRTSQAAATQRAGRAGRIAPGICWRLGSAAQHQSLPARAEAEARTADLTALALDLAEWGLSDTSGLRLLDHPSTVAFMAARSLLTLLGALDEQGRITPHGRLMAGISLHPRLAHLLLKAKEAGQGALGVAIAILISERNPLQRDTDLRNRLQNLRLQEQDSSSRHVTALARRIARQAGIVWDRFETGHPGPILMHAFPDRLAQARGQPGRFRLSGGQGAGLAETDPLARESYLVIADLDGQSPDARIRLAAPLSMEDIGEGFGERIGEEDELLWDSATGSVQALRRRVLGALVLHQKRLPAPDPQAVLPMLLKGIRQAGLDSLPWHAVDRALQARARFLSERDGGDRWVSLADAELLEHLEEWLGPSLDKKSSLRDLAGIDLDPLLRTRIGWDRIAELDRRAPLTVAVPTGRDAVVDYVHGDVPVLAIRLQELFGLDATPAIDEGRVPLLIHLLSPAGQPIQVTRDLPGFWRGSYKQVRAELRGKYLRHPWPEDPLTALPTMRAKPRGT